MIFSIITPSFKQLDWLKLCIASVADQLTSTQDFSVEHIVQDAGTPGIEEFAKDISEQFCRQYGSQEISELSPFELLHLRTSSNYTLRIFKESDNGMYDAINSGLRRSGGEICAYLNCDEQYLPRTLSKVALWFLQNPGKDVLFGDTIVVDEEGGYLCDRRVTVPTKWHTQVSGNLSFFTSSTFFRSSVIREKAIFFDPKWKAIGDAAWALELLRRCIPMAAPRLCMSIHTDTGKNLILSERSRLEQKEMFLSAPWIARISKQLVLVYYRLRRAIAGAYWVLPHAYSIYTSASLQRRIQFEVPIPSYRWPGRG